MKILYVLDKPNLYGSELHVLKLINLLEKDYDISLLAFERGPLLELLTNKGIPFSVIKLNWFSVKSLMHLLRFFRSNKFNIVHAHQPKAILWASIFSKLVSTPSIITIHSLPSSSAQSYKNSIKKFSVGLFHYLVKFLSELSATKIIYLSNFSYQQTFFKNKSLIIPNWIDDIVTDEQVKVNFHDTVHFLSVGSVSFNKGMDRMIKSFALIKNERWVITIAGDYKPEFKQQLDKLANDLGISDRIYYVGYVKEVKRLMLDSDGFILLSRGETFGLVYIEAMNCGLPIISWDIPIAKEIIPDGNIIMTGIKDIKQVFPKIYSSPLNYQRQSNINREFVKTNFSTGNIYLKYRNLYDQVLSNNSN